jgi:hypothetical protein
MGKGGSRVRRAGSRMTTARRLGGWLAAAVLAAGCHTPSSPPPVLPPPAAPLPPPDLPIVSPPPIEPDYKTLPALDPLAAAADDVAPPPAGYRGLTEEVCRREAAARAGTAGLFNQENRIPPRVELRPRAELRRAAAKPAADALHREVRVELAAEGRNRAAADALDEFYQLADAEGRGELMRATLPVLDRLRETVRKARAEGVRVPVDPDELDRQRATLLGLIAQADAGARALDIDLKRRVGVPGRAAERLRPVGEFGVRADPIDVEAGVRLALEGRPDLVALREVYLQLSPDTLPVVRELVRGRLGPGGPTDAVRGPLVRPLVSLALARARANRLDAAVLAELAVRRQQLYELIAERERQAADEVRAAAVGLAGEATQVALARWRAEQLAKKAADAKDKGPLVELPAELEAYRARTEVVAAVMSWHRARVKLAAAVGVLGGGSAIDGCR